jgi:hypothetical protein
MGIAPTNVLVINIFVGAVIRFYEKSMSLEEVNKKPFAGLNINSLSRIKEAYSLDKVAEILSAELGARVKVRVSEGLIYCTYRDQGSADLDAGLLGESLPEGYRVEGVEEREDDDLGLVYEVVIKET